MLIFGYSYTYFGYEMKMSDFERLVLNALLKLPPRTSDPCIRVAEELRTTPQSVRNAVARLRRKYDEALAFMNEYRDFKKRIMAKQRRIRL